MKNKVFAKKLGKLVKLKQVRVRVSVPESGEMWHIEGPEQKQSQNEGKQEKGDIPCTCFGLETPSCGK